VHDADQRHQTDLAAKAAQVKPSGTVNMMMSDDSKLWNCAARWHQPASHPCRPARCKDRHRGFRNAGTPQEASVFEFGSAAM